MIGYKLTTEQKDLLVGVEYTTDMYFNPIKDIDGYWFIFSVEVNLCDIAWVKELQPSSFEPKIILLP
jgi:hypothetical protein